MRLELLAECINGRSLSGLRRKQQRRRFTIDERGQVVVPRLLAFSSIPTQRTATGMSFTNIITRASNGSVNPLPGRAHAPPRKRAPGVNQCRGPAAAALIELRARHAPRRGQSHACSKSSVSRIWITLRLDLTRVKGRGARSAAAADNTLATGPTA